MTAMRTGVAAWLWFGLPLLAVQSLLLFGFVANDLPVSGYLLRHLGLCLAAMAVAVGWAALAAPGERQSRLAVALQLVLWMLLAGPFGTAAALILLAPVPASAVLRPADDDAPATPFDRLEHLHGAMLDARLRLPDAHLVRPLRDIIATGSQSEKIDALNVISRRFSAAAAPLLKHALADGDGAVRVLAATIIAQQHDAHTSRIGALQARVAAAPQAPDARAELAQAHLAYADSGLLDAARADAERRRAAQLGDAPAVPQGAEP
jgi:hypothetical protein